MYGIRRFLKRKSTVEGEKSCVERKRNEMPLTSAMRCHDIDDTEQIGKGRLYQMFHL